ncbi:hypothetical protein J2T13_004725 [Paenibacillus sp. DS2015]
MRLIIHTTNATTIVTFFIVTKINMNVVCEIIYANVSIVSVNLN